MNPFSRNKDETIASLGEKRLLRKVREWLGDAAPPPPLGMGDDCAVLPATDRPVVVTTDSVVFGRHFDESADPASVGAKLLNRNLSDIAAMGGNPEYAVVAGFLPRTTRIDWLAAFERGLAECALSHGMKVVGGDLAETASELCLNLTLYGTADRPLLRTGGQPGDRICATGPLGGSLLGRHLTFVPRLQAGKLLAECNSIHAVIDISDGLLIDLLNLLPKNTTASIDPAAVPIHEDAVQTAAQSGKEPLWHALNDGEDHELLFLMDSDETAWEDLRARFRDSGMDPPVCIGKLIHPSRSRILDQSTGKPFPSASGYDHFG